MILERLVEFRERIEGEVIPAFHKEQTIRWFLEISEDGRFLGLTETGSTKRDQTSVVAPYVKRSGSAPPPYLLVDKPDYVLGWTDNEDKRDKAVERHQAYAELVRDCAHTVNDPRLDAYLTFLENHVDEARNSPNAAEMKSGDLIAPRVGGKLLSELALVRRFWQSLQEEKANESSDFEAHCLLCGEHRPIAKTHPIELVLGPDRVGLVTGNKDAFLSYGLKQSEISPVCHACARRYGEALRYLLQSERHHLYLSNVVWLFWTRDEAELNVARLLSQPEPEQVERLLTSVYRGSRPVLKTNEFYALSASSNTSRMVIRSWLETTTERVYERLGQYFECQAVGAWEEEQRPLGLSALAGSLVRRFDDLPQQVPPYLIDNAIRGRPLPLWILQRAVQRARADRDRVMTRPRSALIKLVLQSQPELKEEFMVEAKLSEDHPSRAYQCGRLLAVLDDIQRNAVQARATLIDRYYGSASSTPASVFGVLMRNTQSHLGKLRRDKPGLHHYFHSRLEEIASHIDGFPRTLTLEEQGLFALGYYQQKQSRKSNKATEEVQSQ